MFFLRSIDNKDSSWTCYPCGHFELNILIIGLLGGALIMFNGFSMIFPSQSKIWVNTRVNQQTYMSMHLQGMENRSPLSMGSMTLGDEAQVALCLYQGKHIC